MLNNIVFSPASPVLNRAQLRAKIQPLYDTGTIGTAQTGEVLYFQVPIGQSSKTLRDTNMRQAGTLPAPNIAEVHAIYAHLLQRAPVGTGGYAVTDLLDQQRLVQTAVVQYQMGIGGRIVVEGPADFFPGPWGISGYATASGATAGNVLMVVGNGVKHNTNYYGISAFPELVTPTESFLVKLMFFSTLNMSNSYEVRMVLGCVIGQQTG